MKIEIVVRVDDRLAVLISQLIEAVWDLAEVVAPLTGREVKRVASTRS